MRPPEAVVLIQTAFRGWRTRQRLVWDVRSAVTAFAAEAQQLLDADLLSALGTERHSVPLLQWPTSGGLCLPRTIDVLFGDPYVFPRTQPPEEAASRETTTEEHTDAKAAGHRQQEEALSQIECLMNGPGASVEVSDAPEESDKDEDSVAEETGSAAIVPDYEEWVSIHKDDSDHELSATEDRTQDDQSVEREDSAVLAPLSATDAAPSPTNEDAASNEPMSRPSADDEAPSAAHATRLSVDLILATHSKEEILQELAWARQALRDRRKILRARWRRNVV